MNLNNFFEGIDEVTDGLLAFAIAYGHTTISRDYIKQTLLEAYEFGVDMGITANTPVVAPEGSGTPTPANEVSLHETHEVPADQPVFNFDGPSVPPALTGENPAAGL